MSCYYLIASMPGVTFQIVVSRRFVVVRRRYVSVLVSLAAPPAASSSVQQLLLAKGDRVLAAALVVAQSMLPHLLEVATCLSVPSSPWLVLSVSLCCCCVVWRVQHEQLPEFTSRFLALLKNNARDPLLGELCFFVLFGSWVDCSPSLALSLQQCCLRCWASWLPSSSSAFPATPCGKSVIRNHLFVADRWLAFSRLQIVEAAPMLKKLADAFTEVPQLSSLLTQVQEASAIRSGKRDIRLLSMSLADCSFQDRETERKQTAQSLSRAKPALAAAATTAASLSEADVAKLLGTIRAVLASFGLPADPKWCVLCRRVARAGSAVGPRISW